MGYEELKSKDSKIVKKNKPKPKSKHIKTADLGTAAQFLGDNVGNIITGLGIVSGAVGGKLGHMAWKMRQHNKKIMNRFRD